MGLAPHRVVHQFPEEEDVGAVQAVTRHCQAGAVVTLAASNLLLDAWKECVQPLGFNWHSSTDTESLGVNLALPCSEATGLGSHTTQARVEPQVPAAPSAPEYWYEPWQGDLAPPPSDRSLKTILLSAPLARAAMAIRSRPFLQSPLKFIRI